jgi:hypothetical protein
MTIKMFKTTSAVICSVALYLGGCQEPTSSATSQPLASTSKQNETIDAQDQLCETHSWQEAAGKCKEGQIVSVLPNRWGNEQFPLVMASVVCNFNKTIVQNSGGVVCVFTKKRYDNLLAQASKQSAPDNEKPTTEQRPK